MNSEQQKQMREEFELAFPQLEEGITKDLYFRAFQAAYTPRPSVEVVARAIGIVFVPNSVWNIEEGMKLTRAAQAAIDAIFNKG